MSKQIYSCITNISLKKTLSVTPNKSPKISLSYAKGRAPDMPIHPFQRNGNGWIAEKQFFCQNSSYSDFQNIGLTQSVSVPLTLMSPDPLGSGDKRRIYKTHKKETITKFSGIVKNQIYKSQKNISNNYFLCYSNKRNSVYKNSFLCELKHFYSRLNTQANSSIADYKIKEDKKSLILYSNKSNNFGLCTPYEYPYRGIHQSVGSAHTYAFPIKDWEGKSVSVPLTLMPPGPLGPGGKSVGSAHTSAFPIKVPSKEGTYAFPIKVPSKEGTYAFFRRHFCLPNRRFGRHKSGLCPDFEMTYTLYFVVFFLLIKRKNQNLSKGNRKDLFYCLKSPKFLFDFLEPNFETDFSSTNIGFRAGRSIFSAMQTFSESLALGSNKNGFFQQIYLSHFVSPTGDTKYTMTNESHPRGVLLALNRPKKGIKSLSNISLRKRILFLAQRERLNLKTLFYLQNYSNTLSYSIFCPNQIKSILTLKQRNLSSALNQIGSFTLPNRNAQGGKFMYGAFKKVLNKKSGIKKNKIYPYFYFVKEKKIRFTTFRLSRSLIFFLFLFFFIRLIYPLVYKFPPHQGLYPLHITPHFKKYLEIIQTKMDESLLTPSFSVQGVGGAAKEMTFNYFTKHRLFFDPKDFCIVRRGLHFYNNLNSQNLSEQALQYKITSSFLLPKLMKKSKSVHSPDLCLPNLRLGREGQCTNFLPLNKVLHLSPDPKGSGDLSVSRTLTLNKNQKVKMLPKIVGNEFFSLNANFLDFLYSIIHLKQSFYLSTSLTKKDLYSNLNSKFRILFHSNRLAPIQKKDLFLFNNNYQYFFGLLTRGYYQLSASNFLETCIFLISNNSFLLKSLYFLLKTLLLSKSLLKRERNYNFDPLEGVKLESPFYFKGRYLFKVDQNISTKMEKNTGIASIFIDFSSVFVPTITSFTSFRVEKEEMHSFECTLNSRFSNLGTTPNFLKKIKLMFTSYPISKLTCYPFNPLFLVKRLGTELYPLLGELRKDGQIKLPTLNGIKVPTILLGALPLIKHKCQWNTDTLEDWHLYIPEGDKNTFLTSHNFFNFRGFSIFNLFSKEVTSILHKSENKLTLVLEDLLKYQFIFNILKHKYYKILKVPVEQLHYNLPPLKRRKVVIPNQKALSSYRTQHLKLFSLPKKMKSFVDFPLYVNRKLLTKIYLKNSKIFLNTSTHLSPDPKGSGDISVSGTLTLCKTRLVEQEFKLKVHLLVFIPYRGFSFCFTFVPLSASGTMTHQPLPLSREKNRNYNYCYFGQTLIMPSKLSTKEYFQLLKNWFSKKERNFKTLIKETSLFIRSWCAYYKIVSKSGHSPDLCLPNRRLGREKCLLKKALMLPPGPLGPGGKRNDLCLPNQRLGRETPFRINEKALNVNMSSYYDFLITKLLWKKVFSLIGKKSIRFLGNQRYLNSSNNLTKILYKFFIFIKKEQLWLFIQSLPPSAQKISFWGVPMVHNNEKKFTNFRYKQLYISLPRHSDLILMNHYVLSFYKSPYNYTETSYWLKLLRE